ncbi:MAG TPA: twin-arginine translocase TatA/TatE family subunit [Clostridia bacterium]|nr:twin-arginine translocase TatA/TatE family subunit [Clostridia bacterium]
MNLGMPEMIFIFLMALVIFGPRKLPELGRQLAKAMNEFKRASNEFRNQLETEIDVLDQQQRQQAIKEKPVAGSELVNLSPPEGTVINSPMTPPRPVEESIEPPQHQPWPSGAPSEPIADESATPAPAEQESKRSNA